MSDNGDFLARALLPQTFQNREQRVNGLVTAKVASIEDDGTYRLKFHGMNGQDGDDHSAPARVMMPMAGNNRGFHFFPETGDEVVVGFYMGDTNIPIILGAVWNRDDQPPNQARQSADNNIRTMVSRSGHELTFDDTSGSEKIVLKSQAGHTIVLDDAPGEPKITISSNGGRSIVIDDTPPGSISIQALSCQITLSDGGGTLTLEATAAINLNAPAIALNATALTIGAGAGSSTIDGVPFQLHAHTGVTTGPGVSGPVGT
jgi:phage baseplate assembly protein gpV